MSNFLDKVGLQHVVEKIKGLLSGYLPLSGGTMTGSIVYTDKVTLNGDNLEYTSTGDGNMKDVLISPDMISIDYRGPHDTYGVVNLNSTILQFDGLSMTMNASKRGNINADFTIDHCKNTRFILAKDSINDGLIANNSETVVKELSNDQVLEILNENDASFITGKHYLSEKGLSKLATLVSRNKTIIQTNADTELYSSEEDLEYPIPAYTNYCINFANNWSINSPRSIISLICRGFINIDSFNQLRYIQTFDARDSYLYNDDLSYFFADCAYLTNVDIADWNTNQVTDCSAMFKGCRMIPYIDLSHWDTRNITDTSNMFYGCTNLKVLNLKGWNTQSVETMTNMFEVCALITTLNLGPGFGRMNDSVGTLDLSMMSKWTDDSVQSLLKLYDRKVNGMGVITLKLSVATKSALGNDGIRELTDKGYTIA